MKIKNIILSSSVAVIMAFASSAWADSHSAATDKMAEDAKAEAPARLCIPKDEAAAASEAKSADATEEETTDDDKAEAEKPADGAETEAEKPADDAETEESDEDDTAEEAETAAPEAALPICDDEGNPPEPAKAE